MRIGKRLFPYPLLNNNLLYSQFKESSFEMKYEEILIENEDYIIKAIKYNLTNNYIKQIISNKKAACVCLIECAGTMFRKTYPLYDYPQDIVIPLTEINGKMTISAFIVATEDIPDYVCSDFLEDYEGITFYIEKNDILAVDDGIVDKIEFDGFEDEKKSSIFLVIKDRNIQDGIMNVEYNQSKIVISLPEDQWNRYDKTKTISSYRHLYFSIIAIPALSNALSSLQKTSESVDVLQIDYSWFDSFSRKYMEIHSHELTDEIFSKMDVYVEAQKILDLSVTKSVDDIFAIAMGFTLGSEDDGD